MATDAMTGTIELRVADVWSGGPGANPQRRLILLTEVGGRRVLPLKVGATEGQLIALARHNAPVDRPPTYALMASLVQAAGGRAREITLLRLAEGVTGAVVTVETAQGEQRVDAHPGDGLGLAVTADLPIRVDAAVLAASGIEAAEPDLLDQALAAGTHLRVRERVLERTPVAEIDPADRRPMLTAPSGPSDLDFTGDLAGWKLAGSHPQEYAMTREEAGKGTFCASLQHRGPGASGFGTILQSFPADVYRGTRLRFSAAVKADGVMEWAGLWMRVDKHACVLRYESTAWTPSLTPSGMLAFDNMYDRPIKATRDWQRYEVVLDVPPESAAIFFGLLLHQGGHVWLADVRFETVGPDVPVTAPSATQKEA